MGDRLTLKPILLLNYNNDLWNASSKEYGFQ